MDEIIHLGDYWNEEGLKANREAIMLANREVGRLFARAYKYIKAAASIYEDTAVINGWAIDKAKVSAETKKVLDQYFADRPIAMKEGMERKLFASAITPDGYKNYLNSILTTEKIYILKGQQGTGTEVLLEKIKAEALIRGYNVESYYCPLYPEKLEHLVIDQIGVSFTTSNEYHSSTVKGYGEIDLNAYLDEKVIKTYKGDLEYNKTEFDALMNKAINTIGKAKALHDHMETYYIPNMDFESVQRCWETTMARILEYAK
ncbi:MAG: ATPase [Clostridia bacterium]|nr:ATPase [Clostridia bacterium]